MASAERPRETKKEKEAAADAFTEKLNCTPAAGSEADRFRDADDRLKALPVEAIRALEGFGNGDEAPPPDIALAMECWCLLHEVTPVGVAKCAELAKDPSEFRLVGLSTLNYLEEADLTALKQRAEGLVAADARLRPCKAAEAAAAMIEWVQAALDLRLWAIAQQKNAQ
eukprot:TRINITY_DN12590_c0_g1_i1.p1 TRINITY_DN12590_c0_g1~~TRINITY_DN12590_c0_g1_i1.p1  ORF type:complete len:190 (+),score=60.79 TRINITY_DN12590_c0_g1_i1:64-570(+)